MLRPRSGLAPLRASAAGKGSPQCKTAAGSHRRKSSSFWSKMVLYIRNSKNYVFVFMAGMLIGYEFLRNRDTLKQVISKVGDGPLHYNDDNNNKKENTRVKSYQSEQAKQFYTNALGDQELKEEIGTKPLLRKESSYERQATELSEVAEIPEKQASPNLWLSFSSSLVEQQLVEDHHLLAHRSIPTRTTPHKMETKTLPDHKRKKILVTGGAGFVGSHLVDKLMMQGHEVIVLDNFFTGQKNNIAHWFHHPNFSLVVHDVTEPIHLEVDEIYHLACPASPPHYQYNPVKTIKTSTMGTLNMLGLAKRVKARMLLTSTSEIYGDPEVHPQPESYWGNVNTIGPRACYDEGKRVAETMMYSYRNQNQVKIRVARIFNTFGPRMHPNDGRVVSNFIIQSLQNKNITIYGDGGTQTRSFQYVSDLVEGLHTLMNGNYDFPVNLGNPEEYTVHELARYIRKLTNSKSEIVYYPKSQDDPTKRRPDISVAKEQLGWEPIVQVEEGLKQTIQYFKMVLEDAGGDIIPTGPGAAKPKV